MSSVEADGLLDPGNWPDPVSSKLIPIIVKQGPVQISNINFPNNKEGRKFNSFYYQRRLCNREVVPRSWLVYSIAKNVVFCFCCKLFSSVKSSLSSDRGYDDWKHLSETLLVHEKSANHMKCFLSWIEFHKRLNLGKTIDFHHEKIYQSEVLRWKEVLVRLFSIVKFLASQSLAFRGKSDVLFKRDNGNFLKLVECISQFDPVLSEHCRKFTLKESSVHYLSKDIQNEIINLLYLNVRKIILNGISKWVYYSIILDCTPDSSRIEQMTFIVRFVSCEPGLDPIINEHFLGFIPVHTTTGEFLTEEFLKQLKTLGIPLENMRGQSYDNGANMKGKKVGVQTRILQLNPRAFFVPCNAHSLNLVVNDAASSCNEAASFFGTIQEIFNFFSRSTYRWSVLKKHVTSLTVKQPSETRWESRIDAISPIRYQIGEIYDALFELAVDVQVDALGKNMASILANKLKNFKFMCCLIIWHNILFKINIVSKLLQKENFNILEASKCIRNLLDYFREMRSERGFEGIVVDARELAEVLDVDPEFVAQQRLRPRRRGRAQVNVAEISLDEKLIFRNDLFYFICDQTICSLQERFEQLESYSNLFGILNDIKNVDKNSLLQKCQDLRSKLSYNGHSDIDGLQLFEEINMLAPMLPDNLKTAYDLLKYITVNKFNENFPNLTISLRIMLTLPVSVASGERSFSKLKLIKTYLRSTMLQERLIGLAMLAIEFDLLERLDINEMIREFAEIKARKVAL